MAGAKDKLMGVFDPEGSGYDIDTALAAGMGPQKEAGENQGHFGSVVPTTPAQQSTLGLPENSYMVLKGRKHPTFHKAVAAERARGFDIRKVGDRYFSAPQTGPVLGE